MIQPLWTSLWEIPDRRMEWLVFFGRWVEVIVRWGWVVSVPGCGAGFEGRVVLGIVQGSGPVAGVAGSYGPVAQAVGDRVAGWRREYPGLGADAVTAEGHAGIGRLRAGLREARVGNGFLEGAAVFFARGSG